MEFADDAAGGGAVCAASIPAVKTDIKTIGDFIFFLPPTVQTGRNLGRLPSTVPPASHIPCAREIARTVPARPEPLNAGWRWHESQGQSHFNIGWHESQGQSHFNIGWPASQGQSHSNVIGPRSPPPASRSRCRAFADASKPLQTDRPRDRIAQARCSY